MRSVTDKPNSHVVLTHYHAVRVLGASAYGAEQIIMGDAAGAVVVERGQEDWDSEFQRFPRLFEGCESIPGLTYPTTTFSESMTVYLGNRRVDLMHLGRAHTAHLTIIGLGIIPSRTRRQKVVALHPSIAAASLSRTSESMTFNARPFL